MKKIFEKTIFIFFLLLPIFAFVFLFGGILSKGLVGTVYAQGCTSDSGCTDGDPCTFDQCFVDDGSCIHSNMPAGAVCERDPSTGDQVKCCDGSGGCNVDCRLPSGGGCTDDFYYCDGSSCMHKTGGYWDGTQCVYAFDQVDASNCGGCGGGGDGGGGGGGSNYCTDAGYHDCTNKVGTPAGTCAGTDQNAGKTCTAYETYKCNFDDGTGRKDYCDTSNCADPCSPNSCPVGQVNVAVSQIGQRVNDTIVGSNLQPYTGTGTCGYKYYKWESTLADKSVCATYSFGAWADQSKCPKTASSPSPRTSPLPSRSPGACTVSWVQLPQNPAPNTTATVKVKGVSDPGGWQNVNYRLDGGTWSGNFSSIDAASKTFTFDINSGAAGSHKLEFSTSNKTNICTQTGDFITGSGSSVTTVSFRVAESPTELDGAPWQSYSAEPMKLDLEFKDKTPGVKSVWVEFKDSNGKLERRNAQIRLLGGEPQILGCSLGFEGNSAVFNIAGKNFGTTQGSVTSGTGNLTIREWKDNIIKALFNNPPTGETFPIVVTSSDGQKIEGHCSAISQLALGAKVFCRAPSSHNTDNVALTLAGIFPGGTLTRQKVTIDKEGLIQGLTQKLEESKNYQLSLKAPKSLRQTTDEFTAQGGTTNIPNFILPVGDIFPADGGDGTINSLDKGELNRQWVISVDAGNRSGDFNRDARVNSIDWACMRYDFGQTDDPEPVPGGAAASPSPAGVCAQVITPAKNPATNECQDFPTPCDVPAGWQKVASCN